MRIVATSDTHFNFKSTPEWTIPDGDVFIHAGDFMLSGYMTEWSQRLECFEALPHKTKILVAGNHDIHMGIYAGPALQDLRAIGVHVLGLPTNTDTMQLNNDGTIGKWGSSEGYRLLGLPMVHNLPRWAFNFSEDFLDDYMDHCRRADIVISHCPPAGVLDLSYGIKAYRKYLEEYEPAHWICGHIHEEGGKSKKIGRTMVHNVAALDREYDKFINPPLVLELP